MLIKCNIFYILIIATLIGAANNLLDFCEYRTKLLESNVGLEIPILRSRIYSSTFGDFVTNEKFRNLFVKTFDDQIVDEVIEWRTNIDQMYMVALNKFVPKTLGCVYKQGYHIKRLSNKTTIDIPGLVKVISEEIYNELMDDNTNSNLPVIVMQGSSLHESVFCIFGTLYATRTYFVMQCLFEPPFGIEIPKFIKITEKFEAGNKRNKDHRVLCLSHFPKYCVDSKKQHENTTKLQAKGIEARVAMTSASNRTNDTGSYKTFNITNTSDGWKHLFGHFYCSNCTINILN